MGTLRFLTLALFTIGMMFALHPMPREPWGVLGMGDLFTGYVLSFVGGTLYTVLDLRRRARHQRATVSVLREYRERRAA